MLEMDFPLLLARIHNIPSSNLAFMHQVVHLLQFTHANRLKGTLDEAALEEVESLGGVFSVADIGSLDRLHPDDGFEDGSFQKGTGGHTDGDDGAAGSDVLECLLARI